MPELSRDEQGKDYIIFTLSGEYVAIDSDALSEVLEPVPVSALPLVPDYIDGLINVSGNIIPQIDLAKFIGVPGAYRSATLLVVYVKNSLLALKIGMVQEPVYRSDDELQAMDDDISDNCFASMFSYQGVNVKVFSPSCLENMVKSEQPVSSKKSFLGEFNQREEERVDLQEYLQLRCGEQMYACLLADVYEVVDVASIKKQPGSPASVVGVTLIRNRPTLVLSLAQLLMQKSANKDDHDEVCLDQENYSLLLIRQENFYCALLVDEVVGLRLVKSHELLSGQYDWDQAIVDEDGQVVAQAILLQDFFNAELCHKYISFMPSLDHEYQVQVIPQQELLCFSIKADVYALNIEDVRRILPRKEVQPLLEQHSFLSGAIEFEGAAIPLIDLSLQLAYEQASKGLEYIVINHAGEDWALAVDSVEEILSVDQPSIDCLQKTDDVELLCIKAYVSYQGGLISILDADALCEINLKQLESLGYDSE